MRISEQADKGGVTVGDVAKILQAGSSYVTMETGKLAKQSLIKKSSNPEDRRSILLSLTSRGREKLSSLTSSRQEINNTIFEGYSKRK